MSNYCRPFSRFEALVDAPHTDANNINVGYHIPVGTIKFDRTAFDEGAKMNITTGVYTAPKDGIYLFGIDGHKCSGNALAEVNVYHNNVMEKTVLISDAVPSQKTRLQLTSFWTTDMKIGDQVYLVNNKEKSLYTLGNNPATFQFAFIGFYLS